MPELVDIIAPIAPPPAPADYKGLIFALGVLILILLFILFRHLRRTRHQRLALKKLRRAEAGLLAGKLNARHAAFEIGSALHHRHARCASVRAQARNHPRGTQANEWAAFMAALDESCYAAPEPDAQQTTRLLAQARQWLVRPPC